MKKEEILEYLKQLQTQYNHVFTKIGLFGSYAKDNFDEFSDIDIAVKVNKEYLQTHDVWEYFEAINSIQNSIFNKFHIKSDIFDIDSVSPYKEQILKEIIYV